MGRLDNPFGEIVKPTVRVRESILEDFKRHASKPANAKQLVERLDNWMFGKGGSLAGSIKAQGRGGKAWEPLSDGYLEWKRDMMFSGRDIPGEKVPPRKVISEDIWIRTGKFLEFTQTKGKGRLKKVVIKPGELVKGNPFLEIYVDKIDYWKHADKMRPIAFFTKEDEVAINKIANEWAAEMMTLAIQGVN